MKLIYEEHTSNYQNLGLLSVGYHNVIPVLQAWLSMNQPKQWKLEMKLIYMN